MSGGLDSQTIQNALSKSGFKTGQPSLRLRAFRMMGGGSGSDISDRFPNVIYKKIKEQNLGGKVIKCKRYFFN